MGYKYFKRVPKNPKDKNGTSTLLDVEYFCYLSTACFISPVIGRFITLDLMCYFTCLEL